MKRLLLLCLIVFATTSCEQNLIDAMQPKPSKTLEQAKKRLVDADKWVIDEASLNGQLVYQAGVNLTMDAEVDIEYLKFREDGVFEVKYFNELDESLLWELDAANNKLILKDKTDANYKEDWTILAGSVYEKTFEMTYSETYGSESDTVKIKMKRIE